MDLPLEAKDWWTFLLPGGFVALQLLLIYDILSSFNSPFEHIRLIPFLGTLSTEYLTLFFAGFLVFWVVVGFAVELLSYSVFRGETDKLMPEAILETPKMYGLPDHALQGLTQKCHI